MTSEQMDQMVASFRAMADEQIRKTVRDFELLRDWFPGTAYLVEGRLQLARDEQAYRLLPLVACKHCGKEISLDDPCYLDEQHTACAQARAIPASVAEDIACQKYGWEW